MPGLPNPVTPRSPTASIDQDQHLTEQAAHHCTIRHDGAPSTCPVGPPSLRNPQQDDALARYPCRPRSATEGEKPQLTRAMPHGSPQRGVLSKDRDHSRPFSFAFAAVTTTLRVASRGAVRHRGQSRFSRSPLRRPSGLTRSSLQSRPPPSPATTPVLRTPLYRRSAPYRLEAPWIRHPKAPTPTDREHVGGIAREPATCSLASALGPARLWVRHPAGGSLAGCPRCTAWLINGVPPGRVSLAGSGSRGVCLAGSSSALLAAHCDR